MSLSEALPPLPSVFTSHAVRTDVAGRAVALAPVHGAGTLVWRNGTLEAEAAIVLEPDRPMGAARLAWLCGANALADAIAALAPPELPLRWRWPATMTLNGGVVGHVRLLAPEGTAEDATPPWLVLLMEVRLAWPAGTIPGENPGDTALAEEGFEELATPELVAGWARHLMANMDEWQARDARRVTEKFLARLEDGEGMRRGIEPRTGALVLEADGQRQVLPLA